MCGSGTSPGNRDMRQRSQVVQGMTFTLKVLAKRTIPDPTLDCHRAAFAVQGYHLIEPFQRDKILITIGNPIEGMTAAEHLNFVATTHQFLHLLDRCRTVQSGCAIGDIARPIPLFLRHLCIPRRYSVTTTLISILSKPYYQARQTQRGEQDQPNRHLERKPLNADI